MNFKRSFKKCEEFRICCAYGDKGVVFVDEHEKNKTLYSSIGLDDFSRQNFTAIRLDSGK